MHTEFWWGNLLGRSSHRLEYIIKIALKNIGWNDMDWSHLAKTWQDSLWWPKHYSV